MLGPARRPSFASSHDSFGMTALRAHARATLVVRARFHAETCTVDAASPTGSAPRLVHAPTGSGVADTQAPNRREQLALRHATRHCASDYGQVVMAFVHFDSILFGPLHPAISEDLYRVWGADGAIATRKIARRAVAVAAPADALGMTRVKRQSGHTHQREAGPGAMQGARGAPGGERGSVRGRARRSDHARRKSFRDRTHAVDSAGRALLSEHRARSCGPRAGRERRGSHFEYHLAARASGLHVADGVRGAFERIGAINHHA